MAIKVADKSRVLLFGKESVEGTAVALTGAANAILTKNLSVTIGEGDVSTDEFDGIDSRNVTESSGNLKNTFSFDLPVTTAALASIAKTPAYNDIMQACGFNVTGVVNTSATYTHVPLASVTSATIEM